MSEIIKIVDYIDIKVKNLLSKLEDLEQENGKLKQGLKKSNEIIQKQSYEILQFKQKYHTLKIANSLLGSKEHNKETKLKINSLIREIDTCITQLSD